MCSVCAGQTIKSALQCLNKRCSRSLLLENNKQQAAGGACDEAPGLSRVFSSPLGWMKGFFASVFHRRLFFL